jgi:hypothetical protein
MNTQAVAVGALVVGLVLVVLSFVWPSVHDPRGQWTDENATAHQAAVARVHVGGYLTAGARGGGQMQAGERVDPDLLRKHEQDVKELESLTAKLESARQGPYRIAGILKWSGAGLVALGCISVLVCRQRIE